MTDAGTLPLLGTSKHAVVYCMFPENHKYKREMWKYREADVEGLSIAIGDFPFEDILPQDINHATELYP